MSLTQKIKEGNIVERYRIGILPGFDGSTNLLEPLKDALFPHEAYLFRYPERALSIDEIANALLDQVSDAQISVLLAQSFGGPVAITLAPKLSNLRAIVLISSFTRPPWNFLAPVVLSETPAISTIIQSNMGTWAIAKILLGFRSDLLDLFGNQVVEQILSIPHSVMAARLADILSFDVSHIVPTLPAMLSIEAYCDPIRIGAEVVFSNSGGRSIQLGGVHLLSETQPITVARLVSNFLAKL